MKKKYAPDRMTVPMVADAMAIAVMQMYVDEGGRDFREARRRVLEAFRRCALTDDYGTYDLKRTESRIFYLWEKRGLGRRHKKGK
jgi:hypothetical protein